MQILVLDVSGNHVAYHSEFALVDYDDYVYVDYQDFIYSQLNSSNMKNKRYSKGISITNVALCANLNRQFSQTTIYNTTIIMTFNKAKCGARVFVSL